jgi:hypothetical protein
MGSEGLVPIIGKQNVGKIAERIVANELEASGFLVRDLNLEGISANADLLAIKDGHVWQIQVKGSSYEENDRENYNGWWFQYGYCTEEHIRDKNSKMFNRAKNPLKADCVAMVCVRSPFEYAYLLMPVEIAEIGAQMNLDYGFRPNKEDGESHRPAKVSISFYEKKSRIERIRDGLKREQELLKPYLIDRSRKVDPSQRKQSADITAEVFEKVFADKQQMGIV